MWMRNERMRRLVGRNRIARAVTFGVQNVLQLRLLSGHKHPRTVRLLRKTRKNGDLLLSSDEAFTLHELANAQAALPGAFAEVGVYKGASAVLICAVKGARDLHLFDTFEGLPTGKNAHEKRVFHEGQFAGSLASVKALLSGFSNVFYHKGFFPGTTAGLEDLRFSFVHVDVDLHDATLAALEFFYPRMVPGGIILTHDYSIICGVRHAFETFLATRPERVIELPTTQAMIICGTAEKQAA